MYTRVTLLMILLVITAIVIAITIRVVMLVVTAIECTYNLSEECASTGERGEQAGAQIDCRFAKIAVSVKKKHSSKEEDLCDISL